MPRESASATFSGETGDAAGDRGGLRRLAQVLGGESGGVGIGREQDRDPDAGGLDLVAQRVGESSDGELGRGVPGVADDSDDACGRAGEDDVSSAARHHARENSMGRRGRAAHVGLPLPIEFVERVREEASRESEAGAADEDVAGAGLFLQLVDRPVQGGRVGDVRCVRERALIAWAASRRRVASRAMSETRDPDAAALRAKAAPMPCEPPVMRTCAPSSRVMRRA